LRRARRRREEDSGEELVEGALLVEDVRKTLEKSSSKALF
jgi:hypothetical protein